MNPGDYGSSAAGEGAVDEVRVGFLGQVRLQLDHFLPVRNEGVQCVL